MNGILYITGALADGGVTTAKLADDAVTDAKLAYSINTAIAANTAKTSNATHTGDVTGSTSLTIADGAVTAAKIATNTITADKIATNAVNTGEIVDGAVTADKIASQTITANKIAANAVNTSEITDGAVTAAKLASGVQTTINNNADNRVITGSGTANTLQGESGLTYDGSVLQVNGDGQFTGNDGTANQLKWDKSDDSLYFRDGVKAQFGTGGDLRIDHNGTRSKIENVTGDLKLSSNSIKLTNYDDDETYLTCADDGAVELYYDGSKKFETTSTGIQTVEKVIMKHGNEGVNFKQVFEQGVGNTASCSATVPACVGGGTVTVTVMHNGNNSITTTKMFPIMIGGAGSAQLGSEIFSINHGSTASFSVSAITQGISVTNNAGAHAKVRVTFDITANV